MLQFESLGNQGKTNTVGMTGGRSLADARGSEATPLTPVRAAVCAFLATFIYMADLPLGHAEEARGASFGLRLGGGALALAAGDDTPVMGGYFSDAVELYNGAASAYNASHGLSSASGAAAPIMTPSAMDLRTQLVLITPTIEMGGDGWFFKLEVPIGLGDDVRSYGLGIYPLNIGGHLAGKQRGQELAGYLSAGAAVSYLTFVDSDDAAGALVQGRVAAGLRLRSRGGYAMTFEIGYGLFALGGVVDFAERSTLESYDPRGVAPPPQPGEVVQGGEQQGMVDVSVGFALP